MIVTPVDHVAVSGLEAQLRALGHTSVAAESMAEAISQLETSTFDAIIAAFGPHLRGRAAAARVLSDHGVSLPLIMVGEQDGLHWSLEARRQGASAYLSPPYTTDRVSRVLEDALALRTATANAADGARRRLRHPLLGHSAAIRRVLDAVAMLAMNSTTVLIEGESGSGKELVARMIHELSARAARPYVRINCAAIPDGLAESAFFGHERGAFTGAVRRSLGVFERAHHGSLLLDEIGEMRPDLQAKLLRVLQEREIERVGGTETIGVDVRVIASTNRPLDGEVAEGRFRRDLYFRLDVARIQVPPLRERLEDIPVLVEHFVRAMRPNEHLYMPVATDATIALLQQRQWPGNVRQLQNAVENALVHAPRLPLEPAHFGRIVETLEAQREPSAQLGGGKQVTIHIDGVEEADRSVLSLSSLSLDEAERALIALAMRRANGVMAHAAAMLRVHPRTLSRKLRGAK